MHGARLSLESLTEGFDISVCLVVFSLTVSLGSGQDDAEDPVAGLEKNIPGTPGEFHQFDFSLKVWMVYSQILSVFYIDKLQYYLY